MRFIFWLMKIHWRVCICLCIVRMTYACCMSLNECIGSLFAIDKMIKDITSGRQHQHDASTLSLSRNTHKPSICYHKISRQFSLLFLSAIDFASRITKTCPFHFVIWTKHFWMSNSLVVSNGDLRRSNNSYLIHLWVFSSDFSYSNQVPRIEYKSWSESGSIKPIVIS